MSAAGEVLRQAPLLSNFPKCRQFPSPTNSLGLACRPSRKQSKVARDLLAGRVRSFSLLAISEKCRFFIPIGRRHTLASD